MTVELGQAPGGSLFPDLPSDENLAFAVDVRTIEKWASENGGSRT